MDSNTKKILILLSNPIGTSRLRLDEEIREIKNGLKRTRNLSCFELDECLATRPRDVRRAMLDFQPSIVHFSGHGAGEDGLIFEDESGNIKPITSHALSGLFELFSDTTECVILNACYSESQAKSIVTHIKYVIGMKRAIGDKAAIEFSVGFYDALSAGKTIEMAYKFGCNAIQMSGIDEHLTPSLLKREDILSQPERIYDHNNLDNTKESINITRKLDRINISVSNSIADSFFSRNREHTNYYVRHIQTNEELEKLWLLDKEAYKDVALTTSEFYKWWSTFEYGLKAIFRDEEIVGAIGIWPLSEKVACKFKSGDIKETYLLPEKLSTVKKNPSKYWYASGIVLKSELRKPSKINPIALLLKIGLNIWIESAYVTYPLEILSLAITDDGKKMLERFSFTKINERLSDVDPYPFYILRAQSKYDLIRLLNKRGI